MWHLSTYRVVFVNFFNYSKIFQIFIIKIKAHSALYTTNGNQYHIITIQIVQYHHTWNSLTTLSQLSLFTFFPKGRIKQRFEIISSMGNNGKNNKWYLQNTVQYIHEMFKSPDFFVIQFNI